MRLIIDIDEKLYNTAKEGWYTHADELDGMKAIADGTPVDECKFVRSVKAMTDEELKEWLDKEHTDGKC